MFNENFLDKDGMGHRLELLRRLAQSIEVEIVEIVRKREAESFASPENSIEINLDEQVKKFEIDLIRFALFKSKGKQTNAAKLLKIKRSTLNNKIKRYHISVENYRSLPTIQNES